MMPMVYKGLESERVVELLPAFTYSNRKAIDQGQLETEEDQGEG